MAPMVESLPKPEPLRESYKFPTIGVYLELIKAATLERVKTAAIDRVTTGYPLMGRLRFCEDSPEKFPVALDGSPASHVSGFRKLLAGYLDPNPIVDLSLSDANWWGAANFVISFNLPLFAIGTQDNQDSRTLSGKYLRGRYDLDFLYLRDETATADQQVNTSFHERAVLHEAVYSHVITGRSELYWTAVCLGDGFFEEEPRLAKEEIVEASEDPIIIQAELKATGATRSPRAYALTYLEKELEKIIECHGNVQDWFSKSLDRYLSDINGHLRILKEKEEVFRRERENHHAKERQKRDKRMQQITIAAFVLAILNLIVQVYAGKPDRQDSSSTPGYLTLVIIFIGILWLLCPYVSYYSKKLWELFASKLQNARSSASSLP
ncbi:hypothetical protein IWW34DRAFT_836885 [Fusarium oxysporum f. sp. albedinis]|nr:hypothetical protein IWW34DRAFT_836885 [Fusarium oxysporum f. sp. albedinis]